MVESPDLPESSEKSKPAAKSKRRRGRFALSFLTMAVLVLAGGGIAAYLYGVNLYRRPGPLIEEKTVVIVRGSSLNAIARTLFAEGVIAEPDVFKLAAKIEDKAGALKAGEYAFAAGVSMQEALAQLVEGKTLSHRVTLPEGLTSWDIVQIVNAAPDLQGPPIETVPPEGSLLPDTYFFQRGEMRAQVLERMRDAQLEALDRLWPSRLKDLPFGTRADWVTLASIVEKETGLAEERGLVAGVFVNRLRKGMPLQSDSTVIYAVTKGMGGPLGRGIRKSELRSQDPYNTYTNAGLPPGPIANPGRAALEAAIRPAQTEFLYFVADGSGGHAFARTLNDHNRNVRTWRRIEAGRKSD